MHAPMLLAMFLAGLFSDMNVWVDKVSDMRLHLNDIYMALLMIGWTYVFYGLFTADWRALALGGALTVIVLYCIRNQVFIDEYQYLMGMIPHHSMAVFMSRKLLGRGNIRPDIAGLAEGIIESQEREISFMKRAAASPLWLRPGQEY